MIDDKELVEILVFIVGTIGIDNLIPELQDKMQDNNYEKELLLKLTKWWYSLD